MDKNDHQFSKLIVKKNVDVCRIAKGNMGDKIGKMIMDELAKYADYELKCPFTKVCSLTLKRKSNINAKSKNFILRNIFLLKFTYFRVKNEFQA